MFKATVEGDQAALNDALYQASNSTSPIGPGTTNRPRRPGGYVAPEPLALTCLARELGFTIDVRSDYLPQALVEGTWVGEFPI